MVQIFGGPDVRAGLPPADTQHGPSEGRLHARYVAVLRQWKPRYVEAFPSALYALARWLADHPEPEITARVRGVMLYSENVYDFQMRQFSQVFGCPVLKHYGQSARVFMAATLPDDDRYFSSG